MHVDFVQLDPQGVITREKWQLTSLHCPRCGNGQPHVWALTSTPEVVVEGNRTRVFLCIGCKHVTIGLNGFQPKWSAADRVEQIVKYGGLTHDQEAAQTVRNPQAIPPTGLR